MILLPSLLLLVVCFTQELLATGLESGLVVLNIIIDRFPLTTGCTLWHWDHLRVKGETTKFQTGDTTKSYNTFMISIEGIGE